jgi:hypothetical protein
MARTIPNKGYGGIYGAEAAGKAPENARGQSVNNAASDFASAEKAASGSAPKINDHSTSGSSDIAENGEAISIPRYGGEPVLAGATNGGVTALAAKVTPMGRLAGVFRGSGNSVSKKPLFTIGGLTGLIAVLTMTLSSMLPIHLIENFADLRNTMGAEMNLRGTKMIKHLLNPPKNEAETLFSKRNKMSDRKISQIILVSDWKFRPHLRSDRGNEYYRLAFMEYSNARRYNSGLEEQGMKFVVDGDKMVIKVASVDDLDADGKINWDNVTAKISTEAEFTAKFSEDTTFRNAFNKGARTMTGKNAGWFNTRLSEFLDSNRLTRALFAQFIAEKGDSAVAAARKKIAKQTDAIKSDVQTVSTKTVEDADGDEKFEADGPPTKTPTQISARRAKISAEIKAKADAMQKGGGWVALGAALTCGTALAVAAVSMVYAYQQAMEGLAVVADWLSAGQMPLAGEANDSYHGLGAALTESTVTTAVDDNGDTVELHGGAKVSAVESAGLKQILVGGSIQNGDLSAAKYNMENAINYAQLGIAGVGVCTSALAAASIFGAAVFVLEAIAAILTGGLSILVTVGMEVAGNVITPELLGPVISKAAGMLAMIWATNIATDVLGEDFGNMAANFGARYFFGGHQTNGGVGATYDMALGYYKETRSVLAIQAELDRAAKSPFDITSNNTFLGSISSQMAVYAPRSSSLLGIMASVGSVASSTRNASFFLPASALDELEFHKTIAVDAQDNPTCMRLASIGAVGDQFCNPIRVSDLSTVESDPEALFWKAAFICTENGKGRDIDRCSFSGVRKAVTADEYQLALEHGDLWAQCSVDTRWGEEWGTSGCNGSQYEAYVFEEDAYNNGLESVNPKSDLHKMIEYGVKRNSDIGDFDINIAQAITGGTPKWVGWIPVVGDIVDAINNLNMNDPGVGNWATGANICAGCTPEWDTTYKYLSQYITDSSIYEGMGAIEKSPVTAYIEKEILPYEDRSFEGRLAASMGMPKEFVATTLAYAEDLRNAPRETDALIASAPNIYANHYLGESLNELNVPETDNPCEALENARQCTQIAGTELRRRFNAEAVA